MTRDTLKAALDQWGWTDADVHLIAARENAVYKVTTPSERLALRLHRQGYRTDQELLSETVWMLALADAGVPVPRPIPCRQGHLMHTFAGVQVDAVSWLDGDTMNDQLERSRPEECAQLFHELGMVMARLHLHADTWTPSNCFVRCHWNREGLLGDAPVWDRFWDNPGLTPSERTICLAFREQAQQALEVIGHELDYGLIHADLVGDNVLVHAGEVRLIDFDDGGFGFRLFDVTTALLKHDHRPDYPALREALITGYRNIRPLETEALDLFMVLRAATYVGWNITRMDEEGGRARNDRFIRQLMERARAYLRSST